jgi:6-carboxyhexanoate--CoA ligase
MYYNIKMRAEKNLRHISGAERIVSYDAIQEAVMHLSQRALQHINGAPDDISITVRKITDAVSIIPALPVSEPESHSPADARSILQWELKRLELHHQHILDVFYSLQNMRGAALLHIRSLERMEPDQQRGIRATCMDYLGNQCGAKNHMKEALCLASKVATCPFIMAELCMSDDQDYTTGYFASKSRGYMRLANIKEKGDPRGGRLFLFNGLEANVQECIRYLEEIPILVAMDGVQ